MTTRSLWRWRTATLAATAVAVVAATVQPAASQSSGPPNLALNPSGSGMPSPIESDPGWGGGSYPWQMLDGIVSPPDWQHGLAFTGGRVSYAGQPCGPRQATVAFGTTETVAKVVIWHHGDEHVPATAEVSYWDGSAWSQVATQRVFGAVRASTGYEGISDEYTFGPVQASKVRYSFDNCGQTLSGIPNEHGWIYEFEAFATADAGPGSASDATRVEVVGGALALDMPDVADFAPVTLDGSAQTTSATVDPFAVTDATGTGAGWRLTAQATPFAEIDTDGNYVSGGRTLPPDSLSLEGLAVAADGTASPPPTVAPGPHVLDGMGAVTLLDAAPGSGMGRFVVSPDSLTLGIPADAYARTYRSDVTLSLVTGP